MQQQLRKNINLLSEKVKHDIYNKNIYIWLFGAFHQTIGIKYPISSNKYIEPKAMTPLF